MKRELVIATRNEHKVREIRGILDLLGCAEEFELLSLDDVKDLEPEFDVEEPAGTYEGNAIIKAIGYGNKIGRLVLADDSGIEVNALDGRPGTHSARYGGDASSEEKNNLLLRELLEKGDTDRSAQYVCVVAVYDPSSQKVRTARGEYKGHITTEAFGEGGFGYDPIFFDEELDKTVAEISEKEKNQRSHRAKAIKNIIKLIETDF